MMTYCKEFNCLSESDTKDLAEKISGIAKKGDVFALYGTLGAGKSTFSRFFIQKLTAAKDIPSPTFTLVQMYEAPDFDIYHYDMYRLKFPEEAYELGIEEAFYEGVCLVEWPDKLGHLIPKDIWKIDIETKGNSRLFRIEVTSKEKTQRLEAAFGKK